MKKIGIVGGLGPASTIEYYNRIIENCLKQNEDVYPEIVIDSINMTNLVNSVRIKNYEDVANQIAHSVNNLKNAGADFAAISSNTPHIAWDLMESRFEIPVISILDAVSKHIIKNNYNNVLILGTAETMSNGLFNNVFDTEGINWTLPSNNDIKILGNIIYPNLENGIIIQNDKEKMISIIEDYVKKYSCDSVLLGCTEIPLMIKEGDVGVPIINSTEIHIEKIFEMMK